MQKVLEAFKKTKAYLEILKSQNESKILKAINIDTVDGEVIIEVLFEINLGYVIYAYKKQDEFFTFKEIDFISESQAYNLIQKIGSEVNEGV